MPERPRILITRAKDIPDERWDDYADNVERAGGSAFAFDVGDFISVDTLPPHDGVLVTAGIDVDPARYGQPRSDRVSEVDPHRDAVEVAIIEHAIADGVPMFCICRGFQLFNVALGGSLLQHMEQRDPHRARRGEDGVSIASAWHPVEVSPGSLLRRVAGESALQVNSRHHQAVLADGLAPQAVASAIAPDGIIEAIEVPAHPWALGVQWHPERQEMAGNPSMVSGSLALFDAFVTAAAATVRG